MNELRDIKPGEATIHFWHTIWCEKSMAASDSAAVGRSSYTEDNWKALIKDAVEGLDLNPQDTVLDIGCGTGRLGRAIKERVSRYVGIDYAPMMLVRARKANPAPYLIADARRLPFKDGSFSRVLISGVFGSLDAKDIAKTLKEARRVTSPGGICFASGCFDIEKMGRAEVGGTYMKKHIWHKMCRWAGWNSEVREPNPKLFETLTTFNLKLWALVGALELAL